MTATPSAPSHAGDRGAAGPILIHSPFLRAPEDARAIFVYTALLALGPLAAGAVFFGWRALVVAALSVGTCAALEWAYYRVTRTPALLGRSHAYLTGLLLALTLPPFVPWYVPVVAATFAILVGKAIFGGVGHFLWQPALVGRLAVAVIFANQIANPFPQAEGSWPLLAQNKIIVGDVRDVKVVDDFRQWRKTPEPKGAQGFLLTPPASVLDGLTRPDEDQPEFSALAYQDPDLPAAKPAAMTKLPPISELLYGARPGGIGETCAVVIIIAGLSLIYRSYIKWQLPVAFILSAAAVVALAPLQLQGPADSVLGTWGPPGGWSLHNLLAPLNQWSAPPILREGLDVGVIYVAYQLLSCELLLAAFFLATEMTSRPVTTGGQVLFGIGCGVLAMLLRLYVDVPIPVYVAVLAMNTLSPTIDAVWRPRVLGAKRFAFLRRKAISR